MDFFRECKRQSLFLLFFFLGSTLFQPVSATELIRPSEPESYTASEDSLIIVGLEEMVVSAQRIPVLRSEALRSVRVIDRTWIENSPAQDITELISMVQSVDIRHRGTFGMQSDVSIRGGTFDQTLVLLNGINVTDPQTGHHTLNLPVDLGSIERIEVLHGPAARVFGPNAFQGAINIITREPGKKETGIAVTGGSHRFLTGSAYSGAETGAFSHFLSVTGLTSDGFTENTDFRSGNVFLRSMYRHASGRLDLQAGFNEKAFGANSFYTPRFPDQFEQTRSTFVSLRWHPDTSLRLTPTVYWRRHNDRFELFRGEAPSWYDTHNYHQTDVFGASLNWVHVGRWGTGSIGLDYRYEHIYSNVLGKERSSPRRVRGYDEVYFTHSHGREGLSLMFEYNTAVGALNISSGTLLYLHSELEDAVTFFPGLDVGYTFHPELLWYASLNRTLRLPTFTDLFYEGPDNVGNPELQPEEAVSFETGFRFNRNMLNMDIAFFRRWGTQMIDWVRQPGDDYWQSENLTKVTLSGVEAGFTIYAPGR
ncbi:TonB-dependent receptor, partial [Balneolaceae bacterium ANBcel3]|nr:TonB-dependent receptor [Balneolaceae bacterium ANBcel3]